MEKQYWADALTRNCVWLFQIISERNGRPEIITEKVFLTNKEANDYGESRPYAHGKKGKGWQVYGVPCEGMMAEILGRHGEEFEKYIDHLN